MIKVIHIQNSFEPSKDRIINELEWKGKTLGELIPPLSAPVIVLNQVRVEDLNIIPPDESEIIVHQKQEVSAIAGFVASTFFSTTLATATIGVTIASYAIAGAVVFAGSSLLSSVLAPQKPNFNSSTSSTESSPTYSWARATTRPRAGSPIPVLYGKMKLSGNIIQRRIEYVGDDEYLYLQLALCMGEVEDINEQGIYIDEQVITDYSNVEYRTSNGTISQDVMDYFGDIETPNNFSVEFENTSPVVRQTIGNANEALRLFIQFPRGIYYQNDQGGLDRRTVSFRVEYKKATETTYTLLQRFETASNGGTIAYDTWSFSGAKTSPINREIRIDGLEPDTYDVKVTRLTSVSTDPRLVTTSKWTGIGEIIKDDLAYPTVALLGIRAKATGQLSGDVNVSTIVEKKYLEVFNESGVSQGLKEANNPAWAFWDILTNKQYGYSLDYSQVDFSAIEEWAIWCDELVSNGLSGTEPRCKFNAVLDFESNIWDTLITVATAGRAAPIIRGTKYSVVVDKPTPVTQSFNMSNIIKSSLSVKYVGTENVANEVEVQFINKDKDYSNDTLSVVVPEWFDSTSVVNKTNINQIGITSKSQAYRAGRYHLNYNKHIKRTVEFEASTEAIECEAGDVIEVSHDVPAWGRSGRIESVTSNSLITVDRDIYLEDGKNYKIKIRFDDDSVEEKNIIFNRTQTTSELEIDPLTKTPSAFLPYSIIDKSFEYRKFRIVSITRKNDQTRKITGVEYIESVLDDSQTIISDDNYTELPIFPTVTNLTVSERGEVKTDGTIESFITLDWDIDIFGTSNVYISKDNGITYTSIANDLKDNFYDFNATGLEANKLYYFKVTTRGLFGDYSSLDRATFTVHTFLGTKSGTAITAKERLENLLYDNGLVEKAIRDGLVTIYTGTEQPSSPNYYDLWRVYVSELTVDDFLFNSVEIKGYTLGDTKYAYKYYNENGVWTLCSQSQIEFIESVFAQLSTQALADNKARIFTDTPTAPYDIGDLWIQDNGEIFASTVNQSTAYDAQDWGISPRYTDDTLAQEAKDVADEAHNWSATASSFAVDPVTGLVTGWSYADSSNETSSFLISAERFELRDPTQSANILYQNGTFRTYDVDGNFSQLSGGSLEFYKASDPNTAYKYLKYIQSGTVANGQEVTLSGFDKVPSVIVSPADLTVYDVNYSDQSQALKAYASNLRLESGVVKFIPKAELVVAGNDNIETLDYSYSTSNDVVYSNSFSTPANTTEIEVSLSINSTRSTGTAGEYHNRRSVSEIEIFDGSTWNSVGTPKSVDHLDLTEDSVTISSGAISSDTHTYRIKNSFSDISGTFSTGTEWEYFTETVSDYSTKRIEFYSYDGDIDYTKTSEVSLSYSLKSGEELMSSEYSVAMDLIYAYATPDEADVRSYSLLEETNLVYFESYYGNEYDINLIGSGTTTFSYSSLDILTATTSCTGRSNLGGHSNSTAEIGLDVSNRLLTLNLRKPASSSTTPTNTTSNYVATYTLSSQTQLASGSVNYIAIG